MRNNFPKCVVSPESYYPCNKPFFVQGKLEKYCVSGRFPASIMSKAPCKQLLLLVHLAMMKTVSDWSIAGPLFQKPVATNLRQHKTTLDAIKSNRTIATLHIMYDKPEQAGPLFSLN